MIRNEAAEQAVLGGCLHVEGKHAVRAVAEVVNEDDWFRPHHADLWRLLVELTNEGIPCDPILVFEEAPRRGVKIDAGYLHTLYAAAPLGIDVIYHAQVVADCATRRRVVQAGSRMVQRAESGEVDPVDLVKWASDQVSAARDTRVGVDVLTSNYETFVHSTPDERTMVIPGLLGEGDRLVLTGHGGLGKSTMLQQIAVCAAAGLPPFDFSDEPFDPVRVSILDFENPNHRIKTRLWPMVNECVKKRGADPRENLFVGGSGNPLNLLNSQNALSLLRTIEHDKPQLIYIGPVYKMHNDDPDKESVVKKITDVLDSIRAMGVAIITEAHHTKEGRKGGTLEPSGSNLWTWWPEFGFGLRLAAGDNNYTRRCYLERWRIDRETSQWPDEVEASGQIGLAWARAS